MTEHEKVKAYEEKRMIDIKKELIDAIDQSVS
jgi:hypothetical protein